jgi:quinol monooxygenase YgiN
MLIVRFKVRCKPGMSEQMATAMAAVVEAARSLPGVIHFDVARDVTDENAFVATEVFEDREAMEREEAMPEVAKVLELLQGGAPAGPPEWTIYDVASSESPEL